MGEYRSTRGEKPPVPTSEKKRMTWIYVFRSVVVLVAIVLAGRFINVPRRIPASGYATTSPYAEVRAPAGGVVASVLASSGTEVKAGDVLATLGDELERAALEKTGVEEQLARSELELRKAERAEMLRTHSNSVQVASLALDYAKKRLEITGRLVEKGLASSRDLMADEHQVALAEMQFRQLGEKDISSGEKQLAMLEKRVEAAEAAVKSATAALESKTVRAPIDGKILKHQFHEGEVVRSDQLLFEIFGGEATLLRLRVPERYATRVERGMPVRARLRTDRRLFVRRWLFAEIGDMRDAIQSEGNDAYRVVYCPYDSKEFDVPPGTGADAEILIGRVPLWRLLFDD